MKLMNRKHSYNILYTHRNRVEQQREEKITPVSDFLKVCWNVFISRWRASNHFLFLRYEWIFYTSTPSTHITIEVNGWGNDCLVYKHNKSSKGIERKRSASGCSYKYWNESNCAFIEYSIQTLSLCITFIEYKIHELSIISAIKGMADIFNGPIIN